MANKTVSKIVNSIFHKNHKKEERDDEYHDLIKIKSNICITDKEGNLIEVKSIQPEYVSDIFS